MLRPSLALLCLLTAAAAAADDTPQQKLEAVQHDLDEAQRDRNTLSQADEQLKAELARLQAQSVKAASDAQANERALTTEEHALAQLQSDETAQRRSLDTERARETQLLTALERLAKAPPAAMAFAPGSPVDLARGGMLMSAALPLIEAQAREVATAVEQLSRMEVAIGERRASLAQHQQALGQAQAEIAQTMAKRQALEAQTAAKAKAAQAKLATLVAQAADLRQAIERIEHEQALRLAAQRLPPAPVPAAGPHLLMPVAGDLTKRFGDAEDYGKAKGVTFAARPGAQIVAPCDGEIMFAGPFKGYGQILIIDRGGGYHLLLAGIGRIEGAVGQKLVVGEPVGTMEPDGTPSLYLELRKDGQPVDPLPSLAARDEKASG